MWSPQGEGKRAKGVNRREHCFWTGRLELRMSEHGKLDVYVGKIQFPFKRGRVTHWGVWWVGDWRRKKDGNGSVDDGLPLEKAEFPSEECKWSRRPHTITWAQQSELRQQGHMNGLIPARVLIGVMMVPVGKKSDWDKEARWAERSLRTDWETRKAWSDSRAQGSPRPGRWLQSRWKAWRVEGCSLMGLEFAFKNEAIPSLIGMAALEHRG